MSTKLQPIKVKKVEKTTDDCTIVTFDINEELASDFKYTQGQYLALETEIDDEKIRRSYSLCSSPIENEWKVAIKKVEGGKFSTYANDILSKGDILDVLPPSGRFYTDIKPELDRNFVAFAAGSGITPVISIIKTHLALEPGSSFKLFYINQAVSTIILKEELEGLKNQYMGRLEIFHFLTQEERNIPLFNGRMDRDKLDHIFSDIIETEDIDESFICGPTEMIFLIRDYLYELGLEKDKVHFELFGTATDFKATGKKIKVNPDLVSEITVMEGGKNTTFKIARGSDNILDAALKNSADLPYACKGGVCCTCRAKLVEGEVDMEVSYGLEQEEIDNGYVLTCQAIPKTAKVVVDFEG